MVMPAVTLGLFYAAYVARLTRGGMLDVLNQDFIRTAKAKGVPGHQIVLKHAMRGGLLPVVSFLGPAFAGLITGSFVVEKVFNVPGLGQEFIKSVFNRDYPLIFGTVVFYGALIVLFNLVSDLLQLGMDPRTRR
jgi:oligopeptide transport system permease protein